MSKINVKSQTNGSLVPHPFSVEVYDCQFTQGGLLLLRGGTPPSPPTSKNSLVGVPRSLDGLWKYGIGIFLNQFRGNWLN
jgi:hypothetical protein